MPPAGDSRRAVGVVSDLVVYLQSSVLFETRRHARELHAQRELAEHAEISRIHELRTSLETLLQTLGTQTERSQSELTARLERLEADLRQSIEQSQNALAAALAEIDDHFDHSRGAVDAAQTGLAKARSGGPVEGARAIDQSIVIHRNRGLACNWVGGMRALGQEAIGGGLHTGSLGQQRLHQSRRFLSDPHALAHDQRHVARRGIRWQRSHRYHSG
jgi:hypothetical protein